MTGVQRTFWDLLRGRTKTPAARRSARRRKPAPRPDGMAARYDRVTREMLDRYSIRVRKWRSSMSGVAWTVTYADGSVSRLIEAPRPRGPMSAAVFLHEVGHHAIGIGAVKPRCLEELRAWQFAIDAMTREGLNVTPAVRRRMRDSMAYAASKAVRRNIRELPTEVVAYLAQENA